MSDHYTGVTGNNGEGLALAIASAALLYVWAAFHYWRAARYIEADLDRPIGLEV